MALCHRLLKIFVTRKKIHVIHVKPVEEGSGAWMKVEGTKGKENNMIAAKIDVWAESKNHVAFIFIFQQSTDSRR